MEFWHKSCGELLREKLSPCVGWGVLTLVGLALFNHGVRSAPKCPIGIGSSAEYCSAMTDLDMAQSHLSVVSGLVGLVFSVGGIVGYVSRRRWGS